MRRIVAAILLIAFAILLWAAGGAAPIIQCTDLDSGPNSGGESNNGVYVTIYGLRFGATQSGSTVKFGGGTVATYVSWSDSQIVVQLGSSAASGAVVVNVGGVDSNSDVMFTVRSGGIYFVGPAGNNALDGLTQATAWLTTKKCRQTIAAGDTCYLLNGLLETTEDAFGYILQINSSGTLGNPKAVVGYPGATATLDGTGNNAIDHAIGTPVLGTSPFEYWTIAKLTLKGASGMKLIGRGWRVVGNYYSCPDGNGGTACHEGIKQFDSVFLHNEVTSAGCGEDFAYTTQNCLWISPSQTASTVGTALTLSSGVSGIVAWDHVLAAGQEKRITVVTNSSHFTLDSPFSPDLGAGTAFQYRDYVPNKQYHSVYFSTNASRIEVAYNYIHDNLSCRGIQFHSSPNSPSTILTASSGTPIVLTFAAHPPFVSGERVNVAGVTGNATANATVFIKMTSATTFEEYSDYQLTVPIAGVGSGTGGTVQDGLGQYGVYIHDNYISGQTCDGINPSTMDPSILPVRVYNNVVVNVGRGGPDGLGNFHSTIPGGLSQFAGLDNSCLTDSKPPYGTGNIEFFNNTVYNAGGVGGSTAGALNSNCGAPAAVFTNNIIVQQNGITYLQSGTTGHSGANNLWWPAASPSGFTNNLNADPLFVSAPTDFHLGSSSPAKDAGTSTPTNPRDLEGVSRPQGSAYDLGPYELFGSFPATGRASGGRMSRGGRGVH